MFKHILDRIYHDRTFLAVLGLCVGLLVRSWQLNDDGWIRALDSLTDLVIYIGLGGAAYKSSDGLRDFLKSRAEVKRREAEHLDRTGQYPDYPDPYADEFRNAEQGPEYTPPPPGGRTRPPRI